MPAPLAMVAAGSRGCRRGRVMALTEMPRLATSRARLRVKPSTPALEEA